jgi:hypothetical protein
LFFSRHDGFVSRKAMIVRKKRMVDLIRFGVTVVAVAGLLALTVPDVV